MWGKRKIVDFNVIIVMLHLETTKTVNIFSSGFPTHENITFVAHSIKCIMLLL